MMSFLALTSVMTLGFGAPDAQDDADLTDAPDDGVLLLDDGYAVQGDLLDDMNGGDTSDTFDFARGDSISGFDPENDVLELEYSASLGPPDVTFAHMPGGSGVSVAMNGVVVTEVQGVESLDPDRVVLAAV